MPRPEEYSSDWSNDGGEREGDLARQLVLGRRVQKAAELALRSSNLDFAVARTQAQRSRVGQAVLGGGLADIIAWGVAREVPAEHMRSAIQFTDVRQRQADGGWSSPRELRVAADGDARWMIPGDGSAIIRHPATLSGSEAETLSTLANVLIGEHLRQRG